jgi:hypothetical protein
LKSPKNYLNPPNNRSDKLTEELQTPFKLRFSHRVITDNILITIGLLILDHTKAYSMETWKIKVLKPHATR